MQTEPNGRSRNSARLPMLVGEMAPHQFTYPKVTPIPAPRPTPGMPKGTAGTQR